MQENFHRFFCVEDNGGLEKEREQILRTGSDKSIGETRMSREILQQEIEDARARLHLALESGESVSEFYDKSVYLDQLIADYIDLCEREKECV